MSLIHLSQHGLFHVTTATKGRRPWCTFPGVPEIIIDNLCMTRRLHSAHVFAFCVLPDHIHVILSPGELGLSAFMHSFKRNSSRDANMLLGQDPVPRDRIPRWQRGFHDHELRDERSRNNAHGYVVGNARRHGLMDYAVDWPWTSLHYPHLIDRYSP